MRKSVAILFCLLLSRAVIAAFGSKDAAVFHPVRSMLERLHLTADDFQSLAERRIIVRPLSCRSATEMAAFGVVLADAPPSGFVEAYKTLAVFQNNPYITEMGLFGRVPKLTDLASLTIDPIDVYGLSRARPGDSDIKVSSGELERIQKLSPGGARLNERARAGIAEQYKLMLLERVARYLKSGDAGLGAYVDKSDAVEPGQAFQLLADEQGAQGGLCREGLDYLKHYPVEAPSNSESFFYWAKQKFHDLKSVISLVHLLIHREGERVFIASKQIYSSHYNQAGLSVAELIPFVDDAGAKHTVVVYTIRLQPDMLGGRLGFMKKRMAMPKMELTLKEGLGRIRANIESLRALVSQPITGSGIEIAPANRAASPLASKLTDGLPYGVRRNVIV